MPPDHGTSTDFVPLGAPLTLAALRARVDALHGDSLQRLKGVIRMDDGALHQVQWSVGDLDLAVAPFAGEAPRLGLTCIRQRESHTPSTDPAPFVF